eukprot:9297172-Pyramimonas_sp.AAC.2
MGPTWLPLSVTLARARDDEGTRSLRRLGTTYSQLCPRPPMLCARRHTSGGGLNSTIDAAACQWLKSLSPTRIRQWVNNSPTSSSPNENSTILITLFAVLLSGLAVLVSVRPSSSGFCAAA